MLAVRTVAASRDALGLLEAIKFERLGRHPLNAAKELNLIEQVNQTFTCLVTARALVYLFRRHPEAAPFRISPGEESGSDISSADGSVAAEVFAATHPGSNRKLAKDVAKVRATGAVHRYVFFYCPGSHVEREIDAVKVVPLDLRGRDDIADR